MSIAIDVDGVVCDVITPLQLLICQENGLKAEEYVGKQNEYNALSHMPINDDSQEWYRTEAYVNCALGIYEQAIPYPGIGDIIKGLDDLFRVAAFITYRPGLSHEVTRKMLDDLGGEDIPLVYCRNKVETMRRFYCTWIVEDKLETALAMSAVGNHTFLIDHPYNQHQVWPGITRTTHADIIQHAKEAYYGTGRSIK